MHSHLSVDQLWDEIKNALERGTLASPACRHLLYKVRHKGQFPEGIRTHAGLMYLQRCCHANDARFYIRELQSKGLDGLAQPVQTIDTILYHIRHAEYESADIDYWNIQQQMMEARAITARHILDDVSQRYYAGTDIARLFNDFINHINDAGGQEAAGFCTKESTKKIVLFRLAAEHMRELRRELVVETTFNQHVKDSAPKRLAHAALKTQLPPTAELMP